VLHCIMSILSTLFKFCEGKKVALASWRVGNKKSSGKCFSVMLQLYFCFPCKRGKHNVSTKVKNPMPCAHAIQPAEMTQNDRGALHGQKRWNFLKQLFFNLQ
jgi:hypothetical protein